MKTCSICGIPKDRSEFHKRARSVDGLDPKCKTCQRAYDSTDARRVARRLYGRKRSKKKDHKIRVKASNIVRSEARAKRIPRAQSLTCKCGVRANEYHHPNYSRPLDVVALCIPCHRAEHQIISKTGLGFW